MKGFGIVVATQKDPKLNRSDFLVHHRLLTIK